MSRSLKKAPIVKDKVKYFQRLANRQERRRAKTCIRKGIFELAEGRLTRKGDYSITDYIFTLSKKDMPSIREWYKFIGK